MKIYIAGISGDTQYVHSLKSFYHIRKNPGDTRVERASGRGDVARRLACNEFLEGDCDAIALFDLDMLHRKDILDRFRFYDLDMVTGHYYARNGRNIHSVCWVDTNGKWPFSPLVDIPREGMHPIAITGMGCVLIKREVVEAVGDYLPKGDHPFAIGPLPEITGDHSSLGTDHRFFAIAHHLGYKLWLDADVESRHGTVFWLNHEIADRLYDGGKTVERLDEIAELIKEVEGMDEKFLAVRIDRMKAKLNDLLAQKQQAQKTVDFLERQIVAVRAVISEEDYLLKEMQAGTPFPVASEEEKKDMIEYRTGIPEVSEKEAIQARTGVLRSEADGFVADIQTIRGTSQLQRDA